MHRVTPHHTANRSYTAGGSRSVVDKVDDSKMMQEMQGNFMKGETRQEIESPQNYGFTSVVLPAKKGKDGQIEESAEAFIGFQGGNRSFPVAYVMDDRRHRPYGLKPGENAQYDDIGQMTLMRRNGLFMLTLDSEDESQSQSGGAAPGQHAESGQGKKVERFVSMRHVEKKKQERKKSTGGQDQTAGGGGATPAAQAAAGGSQSGSQSSQDFKHEGETVNTEVRCSKNRIEFRVGDEVVGYYDKGAKRWSFTGEMRLGADDAKHPVYGVGDGGTGTTTDKTGVGAVLVKAPNPGPPTSLDTEP